MFSVLCRLRLAATSECDNNAQPVRPCAQKNPANSTTRTITSSDDVNVFALVVWTVSRIAQTVVDQFWWIFFGDVGCPTYNKGLDFGDDPELQILPIPPQKKHVGRRSVLKIGDPKWEALRAESGVRVLEEGAFEARFQRKGNQSPPYQVGYLESSVISSVGFRAKTGCQVVFIHFKNSRCNFPELQTCHDSTLPWPNMLIGFLLATELFGAR